MDRGVIFERVLLALLPLLVLWGIGSFGLWEPWEVDVVRAADANAASQPPLTRWLIATSIRALGPSEWAIRLPLALSGVLTCGAAYLLLARYATDRAAAIAAIATATSPLFLLNARETMGAAVGFVTQTWVAIAALSACRQRDRSLVPRTLQYASLGAAALTSTLASGVLLGPFPPMAAVSVWSLLSRSQGRPRDRLAIWLNSVGVVVMGGGILRAVVRDAPVYSAWLGGQALGVEPPTYDAWLESIFHGFAPWSPALLVAGFWVLLPRADRRAETQDLGWYCWLWISFGYVSWTLFASRYGPAPCLTIVPLAALIAIWFDEVTVEDGVHWPAAVVVALLMGLLVRDYALYPESALRALAVGDLELPEVYKPQLAWTTLFMVAGGVFFLMLTSHPTMRRPRPNRALEAVVRLWRLGPVQRGWILIAIVLLGACLVIGLLAYIVDLRLTSLARRVAQKAVFVPFAIATLALGLPWLSYGVGRLGEQRGLPVLAAAIAVGGYVSIGFQPALSQHYSSRDVYIAYQRLAESGEPLATYRASPAASVSHADTPVERIEDRSKAIDYLRQPGRRWLIVKQDDIPTFDRAYRRETGNHLFVADAHSARLALIASKPVEGRENANVLADAVVRKPPPIEHPVGAIFADQIELIGYDLRLPRERYVGAGQRFGIVWYWRALKATPGSYQVFVHIDGRGRRINGDHIPVAGRYPINLWEPGDVIIDAQELTVPANLPNGNYPIYVGLFSGRKRLDIVEGPDDGSDRLGVGVLPVR